jgi:hypothetical protein
VFKWLAGRTKSEVTKPVEYEDLAHQPLDVLEETIKRISNQPPPAFTANSAQAISRRLIDIACFDENVEMEKRERALVLEEVLWKDIENALKSHPDVLKTMREARETHMEHARVGGVFSLMRKIRHTPPDRVISEIISLKNASLLPNFPKEPLAEQRGHIIRELLRDRALSQVTQDWVKKDEGAISSLKTANAVATAGWLVLIRDPTAMWAFASDERLELGKYLDDYERARSKLVALGVIQPSQSPTVSPTPEPRLIHDLMLQSAADGTTRDAAGNAERYRGRLAILTEDARGNFMTVIFGLRVFIWKKALASVYGSTFAGTVLSANPNAGWVEPIQPFLTKLEHLYDVALSGDPKATGLHNLIVATETLDFIDRSLPKDDQDRLVQGFGDIFLSELFQFPQQVRFFLRFAIHGQADVPYAMTEDALDR